MPKNKIQLMPGVNEVETPAMNQAGISTSNLIRFMPDGRGNALVQKLGGWLKYYSGAFSSVIRAIWAWEDSNSNQLLAAGCDDGAYSITGYYPNNVKSAITQQLYQMNIPVAVSSTAGSSILTVTDTGSNLFQYSAVNFVAPVSIGGIVLSGLYQIYANLSANAFYVQSQTLLGALNPALYTATSTQYQVYGSVSASSAAGTCILTFTGPVTFPTSSTIFVSGMNTAGFNGTFAVTASSPTTVSFACATSGSDSATQVAILGGPSVPLFFTTSGSGAIRVVLPNHGYGVGSTFPILIYATVGGITLYGNYVVQSVPDVHSFTITSLNAVTSTASVFMNSGAMYNVYYIGVGQIPSASGYGAGGYGAGGYGTGTTLTAYRSFATASASGTGSVATVVFTGVCFIPPGSVIAVSGVTPSGYNSTGVTVVSCTPGASTTSITYNSAGAGSQTVAGTLAVATWNTYPTIGTYATTSASGTGSSTPIVTLTFSGNVYVPAGYWATVAGVTPVGYNGTYQVLSSSFGSGTTTITYSCLAVGAQTAAGTIKVFNKTTDWTMDNWGDVLIGCPEGGPLYYWYYYQGQASLNIVPNCPPVNIGHFVAMPQRQIIAYGSTVTGILDPLLIRWCDVNNYFAWVGSVTNQAGQYRLPRGSRIVGGLQGPQFGFIWTDLALWTMQYTGQPYVYSTNEISTGCGLIAKKAACVINSVVYWMGNSQFFRYGGNGVEIIPCPIWDVVFQQLDSTNLSKIRAAANSRYNEVSWFFPTTSSGGENGVYVKLNTLMGAWDYGNMSRTAWINESVLGPPMGAGFPLGSTSGNSYIYQHENTNDADGAAMPSNLTTGYFAVSEGEYKTFIDELWPDFKYGTYGSNASANVQMTFYGRDFPDDTVESVASWGPYTFSTSFQWVNPRIRCRLLSFTLGTNDIGSFWRIGAIRYRGQPDGKY